MIYEIRARKYMGIESNSIDRYFKSRKKAEELVKELNECLDVYYVKPIKLEDE